MKSLVFIVFIFVGTSSFANTSCKDLIKDFRAMVEAQNQILKSSNSNHETAASTLEEYALLMQDSKSATAVSFKMNQSAQAFRKRGVQGQALASKLQVAATELVDQLETCLK